MLVRQLKRRSYCIKSGAIRSCKRVDHGTTVTDSMEIEQKRGMTVRSTTVSFNWQGCKINLIDTPGHVDFLAAGVSIRIEPLAMGEGIQYESEVSFGYLRKSFQNAVQEGVLFALKKGLTEQNEVTDVKVILTDAFYDSVTSTPADFRKLMPIAVHKALEMAEVELLEPWLSYELNAPVLYEKQAVYELTRMRGTLSNMEHDQDLMTITGTIPIDTSKSFADAFTKYTEGKGSFQTEFWKFLPCSNQ